MTRMENMTNDDFNRSYELLDEYTDKRQLIFFGAPGSGKSHKIKGVIGSISENNVFRTTFHPDTDYASFVGCYKPTAGDKGKITYEYVPQVFTKAYMRAWEDLNNPVFLIIEEINRGNCAQIFGDLFQLLDRDTNGWSEYPIEPDAEMKKYLEKEHAGALKDGKLRLPHNLYIWATMNTSDQSLFPMDSAFKRRWAWEYIPIEYDKKDSQYFKIHIDEEHQYHWETFLKIINKKILEATESEDKQMGNFFIKGDVKREEFVSKVMFYLWSEVCKDNYKTKGNFFRYIPKESSEGEEFTFNELFGEKSCDKLLGFMDLLNNEANNDEGIKREGGNKLFWSDDDDKKAEEARQCIGGIVILNISKSLKGKDGGKDGKYNENDVYECVRGDWKINPSKARLVLAYKEKKIVGVFKVEKWQLANKYCFIKKEDDSSDFKELKKKLIGRVVKEKYQWRPGQGQSIKQVNSLDDIVESDSPSE